MRTKATSEPKGFWKVLLVLELICFAPAILLLLLGVILIPIQIMAIFDEPLLWQGPVYLIGSVVFGIVGLATLAFVLGKWLGGATSIQTPELVALGAVLGSLPVVPIALFGDTWLWRLSGILPLAVSAQILFLARHLVFPTRRVVYRSMAAGLVVATVVPLMFFLNPFATSRQALLDRLDTWRSITPDRYEYTMQLSGWLSPQELTAKRIVVENAEVTSVTYLRGRAGDTPGDPLASDVWTIERIFSELMAAQEMGFRVSARFDESWGFVERAFVENSFEPQSGWEVEVRNFRLHDAETDAQE